MRLVSAGPTGSPPIHSRRKVPAADQIAAAVPTREALTGVQAGLFKAIHATFRAGTSINLKPITQEADPIGLLGGINTYSYAYSSPVRYVDPFGLEVLLCKQPAFGIKWNPVDHYWIKTDTVERGMGGTRGNEPGNQSGDWPGDRVQVIDHSGRSTQASASCSVVENVDEQKVNNLLKLGRPLGRWWPTNQCHSFARGVLEHARTTPPNLYPFDQPWLWGF